MKEKSKWQKYLDQNLWPMIIIAVLTGTVAINLAVLTIAQQNPPELMSETYYEDGYNLKDVVNKQQATERTGWKVTAQAIAGEKGEAPVVMLTVVDQAGLPCSLIKGTAALYRPSDKHLDIEAAMLTEVGGGRYVMKAPRVLEHGAWQCVCDLAQGSKTYSNRVPLFVN